MAIRSDAPDDRSVRGAGTRAARGAGRTCPPDRRSISGVPANPLSRGGRSCEITPAPPVWPPGAGCLRPDRAPRSAPLARGPEHDRPAPSTVCKYPGGRAAGGGAPSPPAKCEPARQAPKSERPQKQTGPRRSPLHHILAADQAARPTSTSSTVFAAPASSVPDTAATSRVRRSSAAS